ncbi:MAG TPA: hypothetical protein QF753_07590 [Victivallales bacterium]|nr:hypothetical protein [Victivallales bacterium]
MKSKNSSESKLDKTVNLEKILVEEVNYLNRINDIDHWPLDDMKFLLDRSHTNYPFL